MLRAIKTKRGALPRKPSALITLALDDLEKVEGDSKYRINMNTWHTVSTVTSDVGVGTVCTVCLAGAVMAKTLGARADRDNQPECYASTAVLYKLFALNCFRVGNVIDGLWSMGYRKEAYDVRWRRGKTRRVPDYALDPVGFKRAMRRLVSVLEKEGL